MLTLCRASRRRPTNRLPIAVSWVLRDQLLHNLKPALILRPGGGHILLSYQHVAKPAIAYRQIALPIGVAWVTVGELEKLLQHALELRFGAVKIPLYH